MASVQGQKQVWSPVSTSPGVKATWEKSITHNGIKYTLTTTSKNEQQRTDLFNKFQAELTKSGTSSPNIARHEDGSPRAVQLRGFLRIKLAEATVKEEKIWSQTQKNTGAIRNLKLALNRFEQDAKSTIEINKTIADLGKAKLELTNESGKISQSRGELLNSRNKSPERTEQLKRLQTRQKGLSLQTKKIDNEIARLTKAKTASAAADHQRLVGAKQQLWSDRAKKFNEHKNIVLESGKAKSELHGLQRSLTKMEKKLENPKIKPYIQKAAESEIEQVTAKIAAKQKQIQELEANLSKVEGELGILKDVRQQLNRERADSRKSS